MAMVGIALRTKAWKLHLPSTLKTQYKENHELPGGQSEVQMRNCWQKSPWKKHKNAQ